MYFVQKHSSVLAFKQELTIVSLDFLSFSCSGSFLLSFVCQPFNESCVMNILLSICETHVPTLERTAESSRGREKH